MGSLSLDHRMRISQSLRGWKHPNWKGGKTPVQKRCRNQWQYRQWKIKVLERDGHKCQECGKKDVKLEIDHVKPLKDFPSLRYEVANGRALCSPCHQVKTLAERRAAVVSG